jgi:thiamine pyrophosphate-dependent acetolactate synthase large subunit-like protein
VQAGAREALERLAEPVGALLATTAPANSLFGGSPRSVGIAGGFASPLATRPLGEADLVLAFGASLNYWTTREGQMFGSARIVQVDVDPAAISRQGPVALGAADAAALAEELEGRGLRREGYAASLPELAAYRRRDEIDDRSTAELIDPRTLTVLLDDLLPEDRTVAIDSGHFMG